MDKQQLTGKVTEKKVANGSKSEHMGIFLETDAGDYQLRRVGANPFSDPVLGKMVGKEVTATGNVLNQNLFLAQTVVSTGAKKKDNT